MCMISNKTVKKPVLRGQFILARTSFSMRKAHVLPYTSADLIYRRGVLIAKMREAPRTPAENLRHFSAGVSEVRYCL
ncbi:hypothetical protein Y032_0230g2975 [Ancylostoma ceylanicum]|uniref:Uncharacterized protein n=1 Tax=Ancylostoma ceylanicum TaxID=53326 RepID=A0A016SH33_9BILA|nr:hypothetical protein Y032_0230g2975 [Ancylostoma ceylanicum]